jgi:hypothetical protein
MASQRMHRPTAKEIRNTFFAMLERLEEDALTISDEIVGKTKLVHLELFRAHCTDISDPEVLTDFCISAVATMKYSIDAARLGGRQGQSIEKVLKRMQVRDRVDLSSILFQGLQRLGFVNVRDRNLKPAE